MQRKFLTNLGLLLFLNLLIKPFWIFGIDLTVQRTVGVADYGFYSVVLNLSFLFNILLDLGITNFNNRNIAQNNQLLQKHFPGLLALKIFLGIVYLMILFIAAAVLHYNQAQLQLLIWLAFNQFLLSFILYLRSNISGFLMFRTDSLLSVLDRLLMIFFCGILLWGNIFETRFRISWFVYSQTAAYLVTASIAFFIVMRKAEFKRLNWNWPFIIMIMKQSAPFALLVLLMTFYNRLDPVMLEIMLPEGRGNEQAGVYAMAFRLADAANMFALLFAVLLVPIFSKMLKEKQYVGNMVRLSFTLIFSISVMVATGLIFHSSSMMSMLYDSHISEATLVFRLIIPCFIAVSTVNIFGTLLTANGNFTYLNLLALAGLVINLVMNLFLIPVLEAAGSALASLVTQFTMAIAQIILVQRIFKFKTDFRYLMNLGLFVSGVVVLGWLSTLVEIHWPMISDSYSWLGNLTVMLVLSATLAIILRLWNLPGFLRMLRQERA